MALNDRVFAGPVAPDAVALAVVVGCVGAIVERCYAGEGGSAGDVSLLQSTVTLADVDAPVATGVQGDAVNATVWPRGEVRLALTATDRGGGVLRIGVEIDGGEPTWQPVAGESCRIWPGTVRAFVVPRPCPARVDAQVTIPTTGLADGTHSVRVLVEDAAGNQATAYGPATKRISAAVGPGGDAVGDADGRAPGSNGGAAPQGALPIGASSAPVRSTLPPVVDPGPPNGTPASSAARLAAHWEGRSSTLRKIRYGARPVLVGQLTTATGIPVRGAAVRVRITSDQRRAGQVDHDALTTDASGRIRWRMPRGIGSRRIELAYHQHVGSSTPTATASVRLEVAAAVRLTLDRKTARQGQSVRLNGRLVGRPLPRIGSVIELQARNPGRKWITFRTVRANRKGRFRSRYRFRMPGPATFQMRARMRKSGDYPYATGVSPARTIRMR